MSKKISKEEMWRREGMSFAFRIAEKEGVEGLREDLRKRNAIDCPVGITKAAMDEFTMNVKNMVLDTVTILLADALHISEGYGQKRVQRVIDYIQLKAECIGEGYATWQDYIDALREETGMEFSIRENMENVKHNKE